MRGAALQFNGVGAMLSCRPSLEEKEFPACLWIKPAEEQLATAQS